MSVPSWIPYTVFVMLFCVIIGALAHIQHTQPSCPHHAFHYAGDDHRVSRAEWAEFICEGCHPESYCLAKSGLGGPRTCGDGQAELAGGSPVSGCLYSFEQLDSPWKQTDMVTERIQSGAGDGFLSTDELWRPECNLFRDIVGLADIDPHVLLIVFLPPLLFESACFGVDYGLFRKQIVQIVLLAVPAMALASVITGLLIWGLTSAAGLHWTFLASWLAGVINSATDPVAVVALLKELGASKALGTLIEVRVRQGCSLCPHPPLQAKAMMTRPAHLSAQCFSPHAPA